MVYIQFLYHNLLFKLTVPAQPHSAVTYSYSKISCATLNYGYAQTQCGAKLHLIKQLMLQTPLKLQRQQL